MSDHLARMCAAEKNAMNAFGLAKDLQGRVSFLEQELGRRDAIVAQLSNQVQALAHENALAKAREMETASRG